MSKKLKIVLTSIILFTHLGCKQLDTQREDIVALLASKQKFKPVESEGYGIRENGLCSSSLFLNSDSTFLHETGCEGDSYITIGTWKFIKDSIELNALESTKLCLVSNIELSKKTINNSQTIFLIIDKTGEPISNFIIVPIKKTEKYTFTSNAEMVLNSKREMLKSVKQMKKA